MSDQTDSDKKDALGVHENTVSLIEVLTILVSQKKLIIGFAVVSLIASISVSLLMTPIFKSTAVVMPPQQSQGSGAAAAILGQLGGMASSQLGSLKSPGELYVGMLNSRTIADGLINEFKLKERYKAKTIDDARKMLSNATVIVAGKDTLISITVEDKDPQFAANLANAYVSSLTRLTENLSISEASRRRKFFEQQMLTSKNDLANAEVALAKIQETTGMIELDGQVKGLISNVAQLQGEIAAKEVQLSAVRSYATKSNPELLRLQEELRTMNAQMGQLTKGGRPGDDDLIVATRKIPRVGIEYVRGLREVKYYQAIFEVMAKQYELAKMDEAKDAASVQELDKAVPAEKKSRPVRASIILMGTLLGITCGILLALLLDVYRRSRQSRLGRERWRALGHAYRGNK